MRSFISSQRGVNGIGVMTGNTAMSGLRRMASAAVALIESHVSLGKPIMNDASTMMSCFFRRSTACLFWSVVVPLFRLLSCSSVLVSAPR
jgi:hypothetical protein